MLYAGRSLVWVALVMAALVLLCIPAAVGAEGTFETIAARLEQMQIKIGPHQGLWPPEPSYTGAATTGMVCAYARTGDPAYKASAELGGEYILWVGIALGDLLGDEAYTLLRLSEMSDDPDKNKWRTALVDFYQSNRRQGGTTEAYIELFKQIDASTAVFYLAHQTVGAYFVEDQDKEIWRNALLRYLGLVDDTCAFPVMALGVATWGLAETGALDETPVSRFGSVPEWDGVLLRDLPSLLLSHQVPAEEPLGGSFYWRFDHGGGASGGLAAGYTEDAIYGAFGLVAVASTLEEGPSEEMQRAIEAVHAALVNGADVDGTVYEHLSLVGQCYHAYSGEMLQALCLLLEYLEMQSPAAEPDGPDVDVAPTASAP